MVMDAAAADRTILAKKKKDGPFRAVFRSILLSVLHVYDLWAEIHDLLVIDGKQG
jgi:hypothetical protein